MHVHILDLPTDRDFTDITLEAYNNNASEPFIVDTISIVSGLQFDINLEAKEFGNDDNIVPNSEKAFPNGFGVYIGTPSEKTTFTVQSSDPLGSMFLFFDENEVKISKGSSTFFSGGEVFNGDEFTVENWVNADVYATDITLKGFRNNLLINQDKITLVSANIGFIDEEQDYSLDPNSDSDTFFLRENNDHDNLDIHYYILPDTLQVNDVKINVYVGESSHRLISIPGKESTPGNFEKGDNLHVKWLAPLSIAETHPGFYRLELQVELDGLSTPLRTRIADTDIVEPGWQSPKKASGVHDLAWKHRPIIYIHSDEFSGPVDVNIMMDHADLISSSTTPDPVVETSPLDFGMLSNHDDNDFYQDIENDFRDSSMGTKMVFSRGKIQDQHVFLQYWHFEPSSSTPELLTFFHEGDWEMFQVAINTNTPSVKPMAVSASQHFYGQTIRWDSIGNGPNSQDQDYVEKVGYRPKVYIARETHATYFREGFFRTKPGTDNHGSYYNPAPNALSADDETGNVLYNYTLSTFYSSMISHWKGLWGAPLPILGDGPPSPARGTTAVIDRWNDPKGFNNFYRKLSSYPFGTPVHPETEIP